MEVLSVNHTERTIFDNFEPKYFGLKITTKMNELLTYKFNNCVFDIVNNSFNHWFSKLLMMIYIFDNQFIRIGYNAFPPQTPRDEYILIEQEHIVDLPTLCKALEIECPI